MKVQEWGPPGKKRVWDMEKEGVEGGIKECRG